MIIDADGLALALAVIAAAVSLVGILQITHRRDGRTRNRSLAGIRHAVFGLTAIAPLVPAAQVHATAPERIVLVVVWVVLALAGLVVLARQVAAGGMRRATMPDVWNVVFAAAVLLVLVGWSQAPSPAYLMTMARMDMDDMAMTTNAPLPTLVIAFAAIAAAASVIALDRASLVTTRPARGSSTIAAALHRRRAVVAAGTDAAAAMLLCYLLIVLLA